MMCTILSCTSSMGSIQRLKFMLNKEGTSRPIVLLHGALGALQQLDPLKKMLASMGREVYSLNFLGDGGNPFSSPRFGIDEVAGDILSILNENKLTRADIFCYSM